MAKKKDSKDTSRLPAYSVYPPENASTEDKYAYELIKLFAGAMQALNGGILPIKSHWREHLEDILNFHNPGRPPNPKVAARHIETRKLMILDEMERDCGKAKQSTRTVFLEELATARNYNGDTNQLYRDTKPHENAAIAAIITDRLDENDRKEQQAKVERAKKIQARLANGESLDQILYDPDTTGEDFVTIREHQEHGTPLEGYSKEKLSDFEKVEKWMSYGLNLSIIPPGYPRYFNPDFETETFIKKRSKRKKVVSSKLGNKKKI